MTKCSIFLCFVFFFIISPQQIVCRGNISQPIKAIWPPLTSLQPTSYSKAKHWKFTGIRQGCPLSLLFFFSLNIYSPGKNTGMDCHSFSRGASWPRDQTQVSHIAGRLFTDWAIRELNIYIYIFFIEVSLTHNDSGAQQTWFSDKYTRVLFFRLFSIIGYYKILTTGSCAIQ